MPDTILEILRRHARERGGERAYWTPARTWSFAAARRSLQPHRAGPEEPRHRPRATASPASPSSPPTAWRWCSAPTDSARSACRSTGASRRRRSTTSWKNGKAKLHDGGCAFPYAKIRSFVTEEFSSWYGEFEAKDPGHRPAPDDTALQLYSSGTTGLPKGVELTHRNLAVADDGAPCREAIGYHGAPDVMLNVLPTYHIAGVGVALLTASQGRHRACSIPDFDPAKVVAAIAEHRITHAFLVPAMIQFMLQVPGAAKADYSSLKGISYGASPISEKVLIDAMRTFKCHFMQVYGLTETTGAITCLPPEDHDPEGPKKAPAALGRQADRRRRAARGRTPSGRDCAEGEVGEVWIRSAQNMKGYWANAKATADAFVERKPDGLGWFRSGDAGYLRGGYLFLHDRIKDMIVSGGENIYPAEVENVLMQYPAVADGAVIGVPDENWGEAVKACVVLKPGATASAADIIRFMRERIAHYKCPKLGGFPRRHPAQPDRQDPQARAARALLEGPRAARELKARIAAMDPRHIRYELADRVATITLDRPEKLNAFTRRMRDELIDAFGRADADDEVRVVIVTGAGRAFCAGADLSAGRDTFDAANRESAGLEDHRDGGGRVSLAIYASKKPVIAAVNGAAVGVGVTMTLPMDIRIASSAARFGFVFARRGIVPEACSSWFLPKRGRHEPCGRVALHRARVRRRGGARRRPGVARRAARRAAARGARARARDRRQHLARCRWRSRARCSGAWPGADHPMEAHKVDSRGILAMGASPDVAEGVAAFLEKRAPRFPMKREHRHAVVLPVVGGTAF